jgi:hypothetical protein
VQCFGGDQNPEPIRKICERVASLAGERVHDEKNQPNWLTQSLEQWQHCLQFTQPRGSLRDPDSLVAELRPIFLKERPPVEPLASADERRNRKQAVRIASIMIRSAVEIFSPTKIDDVVKYHDSVLGKREPHEVDIVMRGHEPMAVLNALSFEVGNEKSLGQQVDATAWVIEDIKAGKPHMPVGVFVLPPRGLSATYERAISLLPKLRAEVLSEERLPEWAREQAEAVAAAA